MALQEGTIKHYGWIYQNNGFSEAPCHLSSRQVPIGSNQTTHGCATTILNTSNKFDEHLILQKAQQLEHALVTQTLQTQHEEELEQLDDLHIQGMIQAEQKCWKLHTRPYGWTPELTRMMTELHYW